MRRRHPARHEHVLFHLVLDPPDALVHANRLIARHGVGGDDRRARVPLDVASPLEPRRVGVARAHVLGRLMVGLRRDPQPLLLPRCRHFPLASSSRNVFDGMRCLRAHVDPVGASDRSNWNDLNDYGAEGDRKQSVCGSQPGMPQECLGETWEARSEA